MLKTTIPSAADDWHVGRFGVLRATLEQVTGADGRPLFAVEARDRVEDSRGDDVDLAEDATQQALMSIWRDLPQLRDPDKFDAWSYRLLLRACYAEGRRTRRWSTGRVR